jgi:hypothetical protein
LISHILFSLYVNDMPSPSHHVELSLYAKDSAIIATSGKPTLLVRYLETYLNFQRWLSEWRFAINTSKSIADNFRACGTAIHPAPTCKTLRGTNPMGRNYSLSGGDPIYTTQLVASHRSGKKTTQWVGMFGPRLNRKSILSVRNGFLLYKHVMRPMMDYACPAWRSGSRRLQVLQSVSLPC